MDTVKLRLPGSGIFFLAACLLLFTTGTASGREATPMQEPQEDRGGTVVESIQQLRLYDANGDSHVFEIEELPAWARSDRAGALQISPVASGTYATDTDYLLIHPGTGAVVFGGNGSVDLRGSSLLEVRGLRFSDDNTDGREFRIEELGAGAGQFSGMLRVVGVDESGKNLNMIFMDVKQGAPWVGFPGHVVVNGHLGTRGNPTTLGEPLDANGESIRGLPEQSCGTCAVRADRFDADGNGRVDVAETAESLSGAVGCETGQWCTDVQSFEVPAGETRRVSFERSFSHGLPRLVETPTYQPDGSRDRVPAITVESVLRDDGGDVTGVVLRNGDADTAHSGSVAIQGIAR